MENKLNKRNLIQDVFYVLPGLVFALSIMLVRLHLFSMPMTDIYWSEATDASTLTDVFNYWKAITIITAAVLAVVVSVVGYFRGLVLLKKSFLLVPAFVYAAFVLVSLLFSDYEYFALRGMSEHFEGTIVLLSYTIMVIFLANVVDSERRLKCIVYCALGATLLLGILGISQATGNDFFSTTAGQKLMTPNYVLENGIKSWDMIDILAKSGQKVYDFSFTDGEVYQTVYNINYVPLYLSLLIPISAIGFVAFGINEDKKKRWISLAFLLLFGVYLYNFFTANSSSGYLGLAGVFVTALIIFRKNLKKWVKLIVCLTVVLGLVMGLTVSRWLPEIRKAMGEISSLVVVPVFADDVSIQRDYDNEPASVGLPIDFIETYDSYMDFGINNATLRITRDNSASSFIITDDQYNQLYLTNIEGEEGYYQVLDERFHDYVKLALSTDAEGNKYVLIANKYIEWPFIFDGTRFLYHNLVGKNVTLTQIPHSDLIKNYSAGTGRGRIWATTIPMLSHYIVSGAGADIFTFVYPQNDYVFVYNTGGIMNRDLWLSTVTDKAHNLYMQYWVNIGLISLLAWLTLVGYYLVGAVKQFRKRGFAEFSDFVNGGIFCGIIGFLFVAFFNDGSVNTMPMFYTMLGTGLAINMRDKWPSDEPVGETSGSDGADPGEGKKKGKKAKTAAEVMPEM